MTVCTSIIKRISTFFYLELQLSNVKPLTKNKLKDLLGKLKKFKIQTILVLEYKKIGDHKTIHIIFHLSAELIANDSHIDTTFRSMHQSVMTRIKKINSEDCIATTIVKHGIKIFKC